MGSGSPPTGKPSAIPSHMLNGSSPLQSSASSGGGSTTRARDARERESLNTSIQSSFAARVPAEFNTVEANPAAPADTTSNDTEDPRNNTVTLRYAFCTANILLNPLTSDTVVECLECLSMILLATRETKAVP